MLVMDCYQTRLVMIYRDLRDQITSIKKNKGMIFKL